MSINLKENTIVQWYAEREKHKCGYCKIEHGSVSYGMWVELMNVEDYQDLIDRGWRRSGKYCYKPTMNETCCPQYTIRCTALNLHLSKSQKKVLKKFNKYLCDGVLNASNNSNENVNDDDGVNDFFIKEGSSVITDKSFISNAVDEEIEKTVDTNSMGDAPTMEQELVNNGLNTVILSQSAKDTTKSKKGNCKEGQGIDPSKPPCKKAKQLRLERKKEKLLKRGMSLEKLNNTNDQKTLEQFMESLPDETKHKLTIKLESMSKESSTFKETLNLYAKYQNVIHNESLSECDEMQFTQFLVDSPLEPQPFPNGIDEPGFGSFHQQYWMDDKLIAVGVIDILPRCVSSVYFFYDPDYRNLTLGTYGSLSELYFTRSLNTLVPAIKYYYMGFYIHTCLKMRYKSKLSPSYLLCPETYQWFPIEKCTPKLEASKYSRLNEDRNAVDEYLCSANDLDGIRIFEISKHRLLLFKQYKRFSDEQQEFENIGKLVGKKACRSLIFIK
ncbi:unnamed protein product [Brassicogethes aeneus]|uniref:Arginyl-tRNA--protein transferase 1 n=1 Tax=Brassicogethes aeneus TaxID=1431903 RepID=A0A9P0BKD7_BRAAE|nr:unnamed protein product [Brassicogethes aeneus]